MKKGSLSLSINAVVVLVLAIALLGLGLAFTKGMFDKLKGNLVDAIQPPDYKATSEEPIVMSSTMITLKKNQDSRLKISFYNNGGDSAVFPMLECQKGSSTVTNDQFVNGKALVASTQTVAPGSEKGFEFIIKYSKLTEGGANALLPSGDYICNIKFNVCVAGTTSCPDGSSSLVHSESKQVQVSVQ
jgi:hypothetical protein